jgi:hypothetical protein
MTPGRALEMATIGHETSLVVIDGRIVMRDGIVLSADERSVLSSTQTTAMALAQRAGIHGRRGGRA